MLLETSGKPNKLPIKICKDAVKFYGRYLLTENLYHKITVTLKFEHFDKKCSDYAYCEWEDKSHRAKNFIITLKKDLSKKEMLLAIAHEMVHVKQYARGELSDYVRLNKSKWQGVPYDLDTVDYWECPWEIEAHGREKGLYFKFQDYMRIVKKWPLRTSKQK